MNFSTKAQMIILLYKEHLMTYNFSYQPWNSFEKSEIYGNDDSSYQPCNSFEKSEIYGNKSLNLFNVNIDLL